MEGNRELAAGFDNAVDEAMAKMGPPQGDSGDEHAPGEREASDPPPAALRSVKPAAEEPVAEPPADTRLQDRREAAAREQDQRYLARGKKFDEFLNDIEQNPALRQHVMSFWDPQGGAQARPAPVEKKDPLAGYHPEDRAAISALLEERDRVWEQRLEQRLAPFTERLERDAATQEFTNLAKEDPEWETYATREELKAVRGQFPALSLVAAYRLVSQPKLRAGTKTADRQVAKVRDVINRAQPAESQQKRHVKVEKQGMAWDDAFDTAYSKIKASSGSPGR